MPNLATARMAQTNIHGFMSNVHSVMKGKYGKDPTEKREQSKKLSRYFSRMKNYLSQQKDAINDEVKAIHALNNEALTGDQKVLAQLEKLGIYKTRYGAVGGNFMQSGGPEAGILFEKHFGMLVEGIQHAVYEELGRTLPASLDWSGTSNFIWTGASTGTVTNTLAKQLFGEASKSLERSIKEVNASSKDLILSNVAVKPDIDLGTWNAKIILQPKDELQEIYQLIAGHSFSLKSYLADDDNATAHDLRLGNSNVYRAYFGTLSYMGYDSSAIISSFYHAYNDYNDEHCENVGPHMYHIRFIYELTGAGVEYSKNSGRGGNKAFADFFVYNARRSNLNESIFVRSTDEIIYDMIFGTNRGTQVSIMGSPFKEVRLAKSYMRSVI